MLYETRCYETCMEIAYEKYSVHSGYLEGLKITKIPPSI
jgi:hypothetical protein